jgi:hypothetical protein
MDGLITWEHTQLHPKGGPHVAQNTASTGDSAIDDRSTCHVAYAKSINARLGIEIFLGWVKVFSRLRQSKLRGNENVSGMFDPHVIASDLIRLSDILKSAIGAP